MTATRVYKCGICDEIVETDKSRREGGWTLVGANLWHIACRERMDAMPSTLAPSMPRAEWVAELLSRRAAREEYDKDFAPRVLRTAMINGTVFDHEDAMREQLLGWSAA